MSAEQSLRDGNLQGALDQLQEQVRSEPSEAKHRIFLFQLLSVMGQWNRAMTQLNLAGDLDDGSLAMVQTYREALRCEVLRVEIFAGKRTPLIFGEPDPWVAHLVEAAKLCGGGKSGESAPLREQALEAAPAAAGAITVENREKPDAFQWIMDGDTRLGPLLEAVINGRYYWVPFTCVSEIVIEAPTDLRDLVWMPAHFRWSNGGEAVGLIPTRYPGSEENENDAVRMARKTDWHEEDGGVFCGQGQRMLVTDGGDYPLMDIRILRFAADSDETEESEPRDG